MKSIMVLFALALAITLATAAKADAKASVFCKTDKVYNAATDIGLVECAMDLQDGTACFMGPRAEVIDLINDRTFDWGGEEWLDSAKFKGPADISYVFNDGPNEIEEKLSMSRCPKNFFKK